MKHTDLMKHFLNIIWLVLVLWTGTSGFVYGQDGWKLMKEIEKRIICPEFPDREFLVTEFGAINDGVTDSRFSILQAIEKCSTEGGGRVVIPPGKYFLKGPLMLKSNVNLHIAEGAEVIFSPDDSDYLPPVLTRWEGTELFNYSPLVYANHAVNIAITGKGILNGQGSKNIATWKARQKPDQQTLRSMGTGLRPLPERVFGDRHFLRPAFVEPVACSRILIEDVKIVDATFWVIHPLYCNNVIVRGVRIESFNDNNDGCDPESSTDVLIEKCIFRTGDDAIAIKSGRDNDGRKIGQPSENIIIRDCTFDSRINGLCFGSELSGGIRNVFAEDISIVSATDAIFFKSNLDRGGYVDNVHIRDIEAGKIRSSLIKIEPDYKNESKNNYPTLFRDLVFEGINAVSVDGVPITISGFEKLPVRDVLIRNVNVDRSKATLTIGHTENIRVKDFRVNGKVVEYIP